MKVRFLLFLGCCMLFKIGYENLIFGLLNFFLLKFGLKRSGMGFFNFLLG